MHGNMTWAFPLLLLMLAAPVAALSMDVAGSSPGSAVTVALDSEADVIFQVNGGTPYYAHGTTVKFVPHITGTLSVTAMAEGQTIQKTVRITSGSSGDGGSDDDDSGLWKKVVLGPETFNVTAESGETYEVKRRTALGALDASDATYVLNDEWYDQYGTLYLKSINGRAGEGLAGWVYQVNEKSPSVGANTYSVKKDDRVVFYYSESMSAQPEDSVEAIYLKVAFGTSTSNGDDGEESKMMRGSLKPADSSEINLGLPEGVTMTFGAGGARISVLQGAGGGDEEVIVRGDRVIIMRPGLLLTVLTGDLKMEDNSSTGQVRSVTAELMPNTEGLGGLSGAGGRIILTLAGIPGDGSITTGFSDRPSSEMTESLEGLAATEGRSLLGVAYVMEINKTNLKNGEDILGTVIRMEVDPAWVKEHGGTGAIRIVHIADDGTIEFLETRKILETEDSVTFEAESKNGLSSFVLGAIGGGKRAATPVMTAPATGSEAGTTPAPTAPQQTPLWAWATIPALFIGGAAYLMNRKEE
ncbi:DUF4430 domain-containing protein [Methanofollis aquaemaris]|uniref:DUF4430 domain-containing protein n=1 Tax=Methanofollis aquaemaris TaxID=126734 RepID=A0A8A3S5V7_9EURY|nr:DUF4430 domain-containing protein [Methanofollis aquaemaris]QSZ67111.1 DUF4430 domain-containing protein [Methanofollis aquaemaris]